MEYNKILAEMCTVILKSLYNMYNNNHITEKEYLEHIHLKMLYLKDDSKIKEFIYRNMYPI